MAEQLATMRVDYVRTDELDVGDLAPTWHEQLALWLDEAVTDGVAEANAMVLATAGEDGRPTSRTVLCKGLDARGVVFYTNYTSAKSHQLRATRYASATFPWYAQHRQVHVRGTVELVTAAENAAYWAGRPRGSQLGAWASAQSVEVRDRRVLDDALATATRRFSAEEPVPAPPHWGGWRIVPEQVEFWQGRSNRMHDRLRFELDTHDRTWRIRRLAP
ncbi:pyridoxamine 5'-phosphate oxidase [Pseudonocardia sp. MH-G8]|uniref:pyridoxamine 5'-phosphate oxidase n=1 Tax=Pseudonocardia sp. MH-G8 TaxID=1854588 RepID=UPI000BA0C3D3|nr:pyridoxamine 5'-phosphate oxidase [Pseudonocardia sp. MH-G8]OZM83999.1 pyridoxamine 5'-phosphate oxidase [Pseudonocardia sp. MH-G8]